MLIRKGAATMYSRHGIVLGGMSSDRFIDVEFRTPTIHIGQALGQGKG